MTTVAPPALVYKHCLEIQLAHYVYLYGLYQPLKICIIITGLHGYDPFSSTHCMSTIPVAGGGVTFSRYILISRFLVFLSRAMRICHGIFSLLSAATFNPLVHKDHNSESQYIQFPLQNKPVNVINCHNVMVIGKFLFVTALALMG